MANLKIFRKETVTRVEHGPCDSCGEIIEKKQGLVTIYEFDPITKQQGRKWKRHSWCPQVEVEYTRLGDKPGNSNS